ncbi:4-(cytidine 5'-diphospho)-2-C-methyl-D-erythritol kinase [Zongyangia hominis]|uniref:4-diphosphocytidyl-2-C-methyl-D-erythritol kinase n=1 Tax=Zongyangia hominis TaxID=2763677 RepID=A0A926I6J9_9FIRM|nr:4-(cytidine 5'-diphospho)-2-C-methyl-D-erythritol kinase [Zongyangia hominis]MBC8570134.1 4-(cytidine 5'-diphospho)-2-C-methyl-D-erythritol kinase [Zongyangia hominis]
MDAIKIKAPAKINLSIDVVGKRYDGYHLLRMINQSIDLMDTVTVSLGEFDGVVIECEDERVPKDERNTVYKACRAFFAHTGREPVGVRVEIEKEIPIEAGLAGGSADAAAVLVALNHLLETGLSVEELCGIGEKVGADVPFCIQGGTAFVEGIGEVLSPLPPLPKCYFVVSKPDLSIRTADCFRAFDGEGISRRPDIDKITAAVIAGEIGEMASSMCNVLEEVGHYEQIESLKALMLREDALGAVMSGSGSAVVSVFEDKGDAKRCVRELEAAGYADTFLCKPVEYGCTIK